MGKKKAKSLFERVDALLPNKQLQALCEAIEAATVEAAKKPPKQS